MLEAPQGEGGEMNYTKFINDKVDKIVAALMTEKSVPEVRKVIDGVYLSALSDAVAAVEKTNVCKFLKCSNIELNNKCFLENNPEFFASCEKIGHFEDAIKAAIAAIEKLKEEK